jgi:hypothetical protein
MPPKGYAEWLLDMEAASDEGTPALEKAWKASKAEYRQHLTTTAPKTWDGIKAHAANAPVTA